MNPLFDNEKHYLTLDRYLKNKYKNKVFKISLNGNFSCPNRDGKINKSGCIFCSKEGSGDFAGKKEDSIKNQFYNVLEKMERKWSNGLFIAYFQANTNTYDSLANLKKRYDQIVTSTFLLDERIKVLSIATRPDCLNEETVKYLASLKNKVDVWVELGLQTSNEKTAKFINRGYSNDCFIEAVNLLKKYNITTIVHIINGLPYETFEDMINTCKFLNNLSIDGIKIHMLHILKETPLNIIYEKNPFDLLSLEEYTNIVVNQLRLLDESIVIHRVTGDAPKDLLVKPLWTIKKFVVINEIDKLMRKNNYYQGDLCLK